MKENKYLNYCISLATITGAIIAVITYLDNKRHKKIQEDLLYLDKEIKQLQLYKMKNI